MKKRDIALALIRRDVEENGELTVVAMRAAQEHRIGYTAMMAAAREGLRRRAEREAQKAPSSPQTAVIPSPDLVVSAHPKKRPAADEHPEVAAIRRDLQRHERMLTDASPEERQTVEILVANDHALLAAWERKIAAEHEARTNPALTEMRARVDELTFEECVLALIRMPNRGPLHVPMQSPESLQQMRDSVFDFARRGLLNVPPRGARRLPVELLDGKRYFRDDRLGEYRAVDNPHDRRPL